ncbi:MAG: hypothetical protein OXQ28_15635 [Acidobacteriota bacterium]|nr:hypothetical protein [Acidobacteriota bacterium]
MSWALFVEGDYDEVFVRWLLGTLHVEDPDKNYADAAHWDPAVPGLEPLRRFLLGLAG